LPDRHGSRDPSRDLKAAWDALRHERQQPIGDHEPPGGLAQGSDQYLHREHDKVDCAACDRLPADLPQGFRLSWRRGNATYDEPAVDGSEVTDPGTD
jgi:hypothetical protein